MTVAELIDKLREMPQDLPVYITDWNENYAPDMPLSPHQVQVAQPQTFAKVDHPLRVSIG
jgi:hypothetical protein